VSRYKLRVIKKEEFGQKEEMVRKKAKSVIQEESCIKGEYEKGTSSD